MRLLPAVRTLQPLLRSTPPALQAHVRFPRPPRTDPFATRDTLTRAQRLQTLQPLFRPTPPALQARARLPIQPRTDPFATHDTFSRARALATRPPRAPTRVRKVTAPKPTAVTAKPTTFWQKLKAYAKLLKDPEYRSGFNSMAVNQTGDGLVTGGVFMLMSTLAAANPVLSITGLAVVSVVEIALAAICFIHASHLRDNAEESRRSGTNTADERRAYAKRLLKSGIIDAVVAVVLTAGVVGACVAGFGPWPIFGIIVLVKGIQAINKSLENGAWNCLKYSLGSDATQKQQLTMRSTISALEMGAGGMLYGVASLVTFQVLTAVSAAFPPLFFAFSILTVVAGGAMSSGSKIWFGWRAMRRIAHDEKAEAAELAAKADEKRRRLQRRLLHADTKRLTLVDYRQRQLVQANALTRALPLPTPKPYRRAA